MADLAYTVWVRDENNQDVAFGPGDKVPAWAKKQMGPHCFVDESDDSGDEAAVPYADHTKADLKAEVERRNAERAEEGQIDVKATASKEDLVAALEADDSA